MGTPAFAVPALQALIDSPHHVQAVYSQPPRPAHRGKKIHLSPVHQLAEDHNIPVFTPISLKNPDEQAAFAALNADIAVVAAYGLLLPQAILDAPRYGCINIHPSLLPRWRGAAPLQHTILNQDKSSAVCIMQMDKGLDTGAILRQETFDIASNMTASHLHDHCAELGATLTLQTIEAIETITGNTTSRRWRNLCP